MTQFLRSGDFTKKFEAAKIPLERQYPLVDDKGLQQVSYWDMEADVVINYIMRLIFKRSKISYIRLALRLAIILDRFGFVGGN